MLSTWLPVDISAINVKESLNICTTDSYESRKLLETKLYTFELTGHADDGVHKVVVDAGHGGHDPGCQGKHSKEKDIALKIALRTGEYLQSIYPSVEVIYTRKKDIFIPLHKRIALANDKKADLFISIHCNYVGNPKICGTETYVMGLHRAEENLKVAKRENAVVLMEDNFESHYEGYDPNSQVGHILLSMYQNLHLERSIGVAAGIEDGFTRRKSFKSRGVKQAGFVVLRQAAMPSILVESGFLSNRKEEKYLMSNIGQQEIATSIGNALADFFNVEIPIIAKSATSVESKIIDAKDIYTIQVGVFSSKEKDVLPGSTFADQIKITPVGEVFRYTIGSFGDKASASETLEKIKKEGLEDAFIKSL